MVNNGIDVGEARLMLNSEKTVLVTGATGHQGGAVIRHMLPKGWKLRLSQRKTADELRFAGKGCSDALTS
jgi:NADP-dependent 3-hydroxy acid dehydrogenase YdfG